MRVGDRLQQGRRHWVWPLAGVLLLVLSMLSIGLAGTLVLAGGWLLAAGLARAVPGLQGPVSWAASVIMEVAFLALLSGVVARVAPGPHGAGPNLLVLSAPALLGAGLLGWSAWRFRDRLPLVKSSGRPGVAAAVTAVCLAVPLWVASRGRSYGVAWAMSGDARNHVLILRALLQDGGLTLERLRGYPALVNAVSALLSGAGDRASLAPGALMLHDARALATTYILALVAVACLLVAALLVLLPDDIAGRRRLPAPVVVVLLACAATSGSPLVLGTALNDGFLTAFGTLPFAIAALVLAQHCIARPSPAAYALLCPAIGLTLFGWTILVVVPLAVAGVVTSIVHLHHRPLLARNSSTGMQMLWAFGTMAVLAAAVVTIGIAFTQRDKFRAAFLLPGAITGPQLRIVTLLGIVAVAAALSARRRIERLQLLVPFGAAVAGAVLIRWLIAHPGPETTWSYYALKVLWLTAATLVWVPFVPLLRVATSDVQRGLWPTLHRCATTGAWSLAILLLVSFSSTVRAPLPDALVGWQQPGARLVTEVATAGDTRRPFLIWNWSDSGNDRLGDFWAAVVWGSDPAGQLTAPPDVAGWAYAYTGQLPELCPMATTVPGLTIITKSRHLESQLVQSCPMSQADVIVGTTRDPQDR